MKILLASLIGLFTMANNIPSYKGNLNKNIQAFISSNVPLEGTHWKLIELSNTMIPANATSKDMFLILKSDSTVTGNGGCNTFSGSYSLGKKDEISFGAVVRTNVSCPGIDYESQFLNALAKVDHYDIKGDTLFLQNQMLSLAKFVAER